MTHAVTCTHCGASVPRVLLDPQALARVGEHNRRGDREGALTALTSFTHCTIEEGRAWLGHVERCAHALPLRQSDVAALVSVAQAFASVCRPTSWVDDPDHCPECAEHELTLEKAAETHLLPSVLDCPMDFCVPQGIGYFFAELARFALLPDVLPNDWYGDALLLRLSCSSPHDRFHRWCSAAQRSAVFAFLEHLAQTRKELIESYRCQEELLKAMAIWRPDFN